MFSDPEEQERSRARRVRTIQLLRKPEPIIAPRSSPKEEATEEPKEAQMPRVKHLSSQAMEKKLAQKQINMCYCPGTPQNSLMEVDPQPKELSKTCQSQCLKKEQQEGKGEDLEMYDEGQGAKKQQIEDMQDHTMRPKINQSYQKLISDESEL